MPKANAMTEEEKELITKYALTETTEEIRLRIFRELGIMRSPGFVLKTKKKLGLTPSKEVLNKNKLTNFKG